MSLVMRVGVSIFGQIEANRALDVLIEQPQLWKIVARNFASTILNLCKSILHYELGLFTPRRPSFFSAVLTRSLFCEFHRQVCPKA